ncbi:MAG: hypothetical protein LBT90_02120 [Holosporaceae bacterium]|nr:hypothetical protein [Holosporaceae bacterium]
MIDKLKSHRTTEVEYCSINVLLKIFHYFLREVIVSVLCEYLRQISPATG